MMTLNETKIVNAIMDYRMSRGDTRKQILLFGAGAAPKHISAQTGASLPTTRKLLKSMTEKGILKHQHTSSRNCPNMYYINETILVLAALN